MKSTVLTVLSIFAVSGSAHALSVDIQSALTPRAAFDESGAAAGSYDANPQNDAFAAFGDLLSVGSFALDSFAGGQAGYNHQLTLLSEVTCFDGNEIAGIGNQFGFIGQDGGFNTVIDVNDGPGTTVSFMQDADQEMTFAANSPVSLFSTIDSDNADAATHIVARTVQKAGTVVIDHANFAGTASSVFELMVGDIVFFVEDLLAVGNDILGETPSDFDFQDGILVLRSTPKEIPEPMTLAMVGGAALLGAARKRKLA